MSTCVSHHHACDCREEEFKKLKEENTRLRKVVDEARRALGALRPGNSLERALRELDGEGE